jgi:hypothetical protein
LVASADAQGRGHGGLADVARASGISRPTLPKAIDELQGDALGPGRIPHTGAGRQKLWIKDTSILQELESLVDPDTRGDPMSPLRWTCKSTRQLAAALTGRGHPVGYRTVAARLHYLGYSLQANAKTLEGKQHPARDAQFRYIQRRVKDRLAQSLPVISVDTKEKELVGQYRHGGPRLWKWELQRLADESGLELTVCYFPPGTSQGNQIEHRLFNHITMKWRGRPLTSHQVVGDRMGATTSTAGLRVEAELDTRPSPTGVEVSDEQMERINLRPHRFHGEWNYTVKRSKGTL